jgi:disulfide bond formation protein DsbB
MKCNVGGTDMTTRLVAGVVLLLIGFFVPMNAVWQTVILALAAIALITGFIHYCPINSMFKFDSCEHKKDDSGGSAAQS